MSLLPRMAAGITTAIFILSVSVSLSGCAALGGESDTVDASRGAGDGREDIRQVIRERQGDINACYQARLNAVPHLRGKLVLDWLITSSGSVGPVKVAEGVDPVVDQCAVAAVKNWKFSPLKDRPFMKIRYPFALRGK